MHPRIWKNNIRGDCPVHPGEKSYYGLFMDFLRELWDFMKVRKKFWLLPVILVLLGFGALIIATSGSALAPFVYTLF